MNSMVTLASRTRGEAHYSIYHTRSVAKRMRAKPYLMQEQCFFAEASKHKSSSKLQKVYESQL